MSYKHYFDKVSALQAIADKSAQQIGGDIESAGFLAADVENDQRFIPRVDFSKPENFARYGSAESYYAQSIKRITNTYPYDGSLQEKIQWELDSTYIDLHLFDKQYPRTNGYVIMAADGWGTSAVTGDYGSSSAPEYILFQGGPHANPNGMSPYPTKFTGSNYYEPTRNRESNLKFDLQNKGVSVEFWLKKDEFLPSLTKKEVVFDLWNGAATTHASYGRLRIELSASEDGTSPFLVSIMSGAAGVQWSSVGASTVTTASIADGLWHHYAVSFKSASAGIQTRFYIDGELNNQSLLGSTGINEVTGALRAYIGGLTSAPASTSAVRTAGKLSASLDEFRYWKTQRSSKEVGRYWFTDVNGGSNTDPEPYQQTLENVNTKLGVYYKFNEGITNTASYDSTVLDYSGRLTNGTWVGYTSNSRNTGSAIVLSSAAIKEFKDPIIYSNNPAVYRLTNQLQLSGSNYDVNNNASMYNSIPSWITEEDQAGAGQLKSLTQILSSYFDTLQLQIESLSTLGNIVYPSGSQKPLPFTDHLLESRGFVAPEIFLDADILQRLASRSETKVYEKKLVDIKNTIYQNIYNNLAYIFKSKGTEKSFRNLIRCFGIDDELIQLNMYADNTPYALTSTRRNATVAKKYVNFNSRANTQAVVYQSQDASNPNSYGFIPAASELTGGYAYTLETELMFPKKLEKSQAGYINSNAISASLFGVHGTINSQTNTKWADTDAVNFQVYAVRDELDSTNARFVLTGSNGGYMPQLSSALFQELYDNSSWNVAVKVRPERYPLSNFVSGADTGNYVVEFQGVNADAGSVLNSFNVSGTITSPPAGFMTGSRRVYIGAHRQNVTGAIHQKSDVKIAASRFWLNYLEPQAIVAHALDIRNYGALQPHLYAYPFVPSASYGEVSNFDTLVFNWGFNQNTGSNASGQFPVADLSSGSVASATGRYKWLGSLLNYQMTAKGSEFKASSITPIDKDYLVTARQNLVEGILANDMVTVLNKQDQQIFTRDSRPINFFFAFEKSMSQAISDEMINYFATLRDLNTLIGAPVNRYRRRYKGLEHLRQKFFENVGNSEIDFDKFYEFYKWFDTTLTMMLNQLLPASADFAEGVRTTIESHLLERSKYHNKFPFIETQQTSFEVTVTTAAEYLEAVGCPDDDPQGLGFYSRQAPTRRAVGMSERPLLKNWKYNHAPVLTGSQASQMLWWQYSADRNTKAISSSIAAVNVDRQSLLNAIKSSNERSENRPYKFSGGGSVALGAVGSHPSKRSNLVYSYTQPGGETVPGSNIPRNVMVGFSEDVEQLTNTTDVFFPAYKQRLGFGLNATINKDGPKTILDSNILAPFSIYSSSVGASGYNKEVNEHFKAGITLTNLHHDVIGNGPEMPMQGPFTEKFVGGRQHRHIEVNKYDVSKNTTNNIDARTTRPEGYKILLGRCGHQDDGTAGTLGIVGPQYPDPKSDRADTIRGNLYARPKANLSRIETAKRPVNLKNILMTTASATTRLSGTLAHSAIGNYQKNYQVVQTAGRSVNDPFFERQTFSFASDPETIMIGRGEYNQNDKLGYRYPLTPVTDIVFNQKSLYSVAADGASCPSVRIPYNSSIDAGGNGSTYNNAFTLSFWVYPTVAPMSSSNNSHLFTQGVHYIGTTQPARQFLINKDNGKLVWRFGCYLSGAATGFGEIHTVETPFTASAVNQWHHVALTVDTYGTRAGASIGFTNWRLKMYHNGNNLSWNVVNGATQFLMPIASCSVGQTLTLDAYFDDRDPAFGGVYRDGVDGYMDEVSFWNSALHPDSITSLYNNGCPADLETHADVANLVSWWQMGDNVSPLSDSNVIASGSFKDKISTNHGQGKGGMVAADIQDFVNCETQPPIPRQNFELPNRTGANSNQTIIVNRFSAPGSYDTVSRGYLDTAHEEMSAYNALPYRNLNVRGSGSLPSTSIQVRDQLDRPRGLRTLLSLHCGPFGTDAHYGSVPELTYPTTPSYQKVNRNRRLRLETGSIVTASVYDNWWVQHSIPQSDRQYQWITASLQPNATLFGHQVFSGALPPVVPVISSSYVNYSSVAAGGGAGTYGIPVDFVGLNTLIVDPINTTITNYSTLGHDLSVGPGSYRNKHSASFGAISASLNALLLHRGGPYGCPTWKQLRAGPGTHPTVRLQRKNNRLNFALPPKKIDVISGGKVIGKVRGRFSNKNAQYIVPPVSRGSKPMKFIFEDTGPDAQAKNNVVVETTFVNNNVYFPYEGLNNRANIDTTPSENQAFNTLLDYSLSGAAKATILYGAPIYPPDAYAVQERVRTRKNYSIARIWNPKRPSRTILSSFNSQENLIQTSSMWPLDARLDPTTKVAVPGTASTAGELQNSYCKYGNQGATRFSLAAASAYITPFMVGMSEGSIALAGDHPWTAPGQAGLDPYKIYNDFNQNIRVLGKDHTVIPEFRMSEIFENYITTHNQNFLAEVLDTFSITGSALSSSTQTNFYKTFSTTDMLKHLNIIDSGLDSQTNATGQRMRRNSIKLECNALMQFLPYKGFYPAERALEIGTIFSRSFGPVMRTESGRTGAKVINGYDHALWRTVMEPFFAPGILFNTIKSGIAVGNHFLRNTGSYDLDNPRRAPYRTQMADTASYPYRESNLNSTSTGYRIPTNNLASIWLEPSGGTASRCRAASGFYIDPIPFDALRFPEKYLASHYRQYNETGYPGGGSYVSDIESGWIYDANCGSASFGWIYDGVSTNVKQARGWQLAGTPDPRYGAAIDNFCCNVVDFFQPPLKTFLSKDEADFNTVRSGDVYSMDITLAKAPIIDVTGSAVSAAPETFGMYSRASAFGQPGLLQRPGGLQGVPTYAHLTPPYFNGQARARIIFTADTDGQPTLDDIFTKSQIEYLRPIEKDFAVEPAYNTGLFAMQQITSSVDILKRVLFIPDGTATRASRWAIQPYWETPILNFYDVDAVASQVGTGGGAPTGTPEIRGMWHQLGNKLGPREGVHLAVIDSPRYLGADAPGATEIKSLREVVGFESADKRIGDFAAEKIIREAIVIVPFKTVDNQRQFFQVDEEDTRYAEQKTLLDRYLFPPKFDYVTNPGLDAVAFYAFEFSATLDQDDLIKIWQNLPPKLNSSFQRATATVEVKELMDELLSGDGDLQWFVFKVKMKAKKDYNAFKQEGLVEGTPIVESALNLPYSYNWPYDFFSMVELVKIDQAVEYTTGNSTPGDTEE